MHCSIHQTVRRQTSSATEVLAWYIQGPCLGHWITALDLLRYCIGTSSHALHFGGEGEATYHNAGVAASLDNRRQDIHIHSTKEMFDGRPRGKLQLLFQSQTMSYIQQLNAAVKN